MVSSVVYDGVGEGKQDRDLPLWGKEGIRTFHVSFQVGCSYSSEFNPSEEKDL